MIGSSGVNASIVQTPYELHRRKGAIFWQDDAVVQDPEGTDLESSAYH